MNLSKDYYYIYTLYLVYGLEAILRIECGSPSLKLAVELLPTTSIEEEFILHLT